MNTLTRLALTDIATKKARSAVTCAAIFLTLLLFVTVTGISSNMLGSYKLMLRLASGTDYHGYLRASAFTTDSVTLRDLAKSDPSVNEAEISSNVASISLTDDPYNLDGTLRTVESERSLERFFSRISSGRFPENDHELLVGREYFPDAKPGDILALYYASPYDPLSEPIRAEFTVSGVVDSYGENPLCAVLAYSDTLGDTYSFCDSYNVYLRFDNTLNLTGKYDSLTNELLAEYRLDGIDSCGGLNGAFLEALPLNAATIFTIVFTLGTVFAASFLLIGGIYSIALAQDMRSYGMLAVVGMTRGQLRYVIVLRSLILYLVTLPLGLAAGYFIGWRLLSPLMFMGDAEVASASLEFGFSPYIFVVGAAFALISLLLSALFPLRRLDRMSPITAVEYTLSDCGRYADRNIDKYVRINAGGKRRDTGSIFSNAGNKCDNAGSKYRNSGNKLHNAGNICRDADRSSHNFSRKSRCAPTPMRLAACAISRNRKKTAAVSLAQSGAVILFILVSTLSEFATASVYLDMQLSDYIIKPYHSYRYSDSGETYTMPLKVESGAGLCAEFIAEVESCDSLDRMQRIRTAVVTLETPARAVDELGSLRGSYPYYDSWPELEEARLGRLDALVVGIPDDLYPLLVMTDGGQIDEYADGSILFGSAETNGIRSTDDRDLDFAYFRDGDTVSLGGTASDTIASEFIVTVTDTVAPAEKIFNFSGAVNRAVFYLPESVFLHTLGDGTTYALLLYADDIDGGYERLGGELANITAKYANSANPADSAILTDTANPADTAILTDSANHIDSANPENPAVVFDEAAKQRYDELTAQSGAGGYVYESYSVGTTGKLDGLDDTQKRIDSLKTVGYSLSAMIFVVGMLNTVNTSLGSALERRREFAMLEAVGTTRGQLFLVLLSENICGTVLAALICAFVGLPSILVIVRFALNSIVTPDFTVGGVMLLVCALVSAVCGAAAWRLTAGEPLCERLAEE